MKYKFARRGRPSKADIAARDAALAPKPERPEAEILADLTERFTILSLLTEGATDKSSIRSLVCTGAPGVGKTYTVEQILSKSGVPHIIVRGSLSAVNLYKLGYTYRHYGNVIVLDDADKIFTDEEGILVLKAMCDSSQTRTISWMKDSNSLVEDDVPKSYEYNGAMLFLSNLDFQHFVDTGHNKFAEHMGALMGRSLYLDVRMHNRAELGAWVQHIAKEGRIFDREDVPLEIREKVLHFLVEHRDQLRELSIRTLLKLCQLAKSQPKHWESMSRVLLLKS
jgi:hypothetical protein